MLQMWKFLTVLCCFQGLCERECVSLTGMRCEWLCVERLLFRGWLKCCSIRLAVSPRPDVESRTETVFVEIDSVVEVPCCPCPDSPCCCLSVSFVFRDCHGQSVCSQRRDSSSHSHFYSYSSVNVPMYLKVLPPHWMHSAMRWGF